MISFLRFCSVTLICSSILFACAHSPESSKPKKQIQALKIETEGQKIADLAKSFIGAPYKYGGASPKGFDCSGLVFYTHGKLGIHTPRTSSQQYQHAKSIKVSKLNSGDLVFFTLNKKNVSHVGIYIGNGKFVHAPKSGKRVTINHLHDDYWRPRIVSAGRFY